MPKKLTRKNFKTKLKTLDESWVVSANETNISRKFTFPKYIECLMFVTRVSVQSEVLRHYSEIHLTQNFVKITLSTKSEKTVTSLDFDLAKKIDHIYLLSTERNKNKPQF